MICFRPAGGGIMILNLNPRKTHKQHRGLAELLGQPSAKAQLPKCWEVSIESNRETQLLTWWSQRDLSYPSSKV